MIHRVPGLASGPIRFFMCSERSEPVKTCFCCFMTWNAVMSHDNAWFCTETNLEEFRCVWCLTSHVKLHICVTFIFSFLTMIDSRNSDFSAPKADQEATETFRWQRGKEQNPPFCFFCSYQRCFLRVLGSNKMLVAKWSFFWSLDQSM